MAPGRTVPADCLGQQAWRFEIANLASAIKRSAVSADNCAFNPERTGAGSG